MDENILIEKVDISDIPETYHPVVSLVGMDGFMKLCQYAMGDELYFPMRESILRNTRNRIIIQEYNGYNLPDLSHKYNITQRQIKNIIKKSKPY